MSTALDIAFDAYTLRKFGVDQEAYQGRLVAALPGYKLTFSIGRDIPMSVGMDYAINMAVGTDDAPGMTMRAAKNIWPTVVGVVRCGSDGTATNGIVLPIGHQVHVRRTNQPTKIYKIRSNNEFEDSTGKVYRQQEVFGQAYESVAVIDPATDQITTY